MYFDGVESSLFRRKYKGSIEKPTVFGYIFQLWFIRTTASIENRFHERELTV